MSKKRINTALISVYHKTGLAPIVEELKRLGVTIYSTGGTQKYIEELGASVETVEAQTGYPSILGGRVKTLHPKVFGGILARREEEHLRELGKYDIPELDLVIVDLYPFEDTVANTDDEEVIIEKIDIGGVSLIRAAAKNYKDVVIVPSQEEYATLATLLREQDGETSLEDRKKLAYRAFSVTSNYDVAIYQYFNSEASEDGFRASVNKKQTLRYGENPHQTGAFYGDFEAMFDQLGGKPISYNNLVDIDAAVNLMRELKDAAPTFAVLKHTNACGIATRPTVHEAWQAALAGDPVSAFGGILISNAPIDLATAKEIHQLFYEVLIAPAFDADALELLQSKKKRILLQIKGFQAPTQTFKSLLNGVIVHDTDLKTEISDDLKIVTEHTPTIAEIDDLLFANIVAKHLKSNTITLVKNQQLLGMGCGQTSRVDALRQAVAKAKHFGFDLQDSVMASDAFFPFPDCVEIAHEAGVKAVIQPGGSIKDKLSIDACDKNGMAMVMTGTRHFKH